MVTQKQFKEHFRNLLNGKAVYVWGANGQIITKELVDELYNSYGSKTYNRAYYDNKLKEGAGRIGADCSGAFYPLSKGDKTARGYYETCTTKGNIKDMPKNIACMVFNANLTHVAAYMGDGTTIEMKSSAENVHKESFNEARWTYYGIPTWLDTATEVDVESKAKDVVVGAAVAKTTMKVRSAPNASDSSKVLGYIKEGEEVEVLEVLSSGWYKIAWKKATCGFAYTSNAGGGYFTYTAKDVANVTDEVVEEGPAVNIQLNELKLGSTGKQVATLQCILVGRGYEIGNDPIDGKFEGKTDAGVRMYQKEHGLTVDGVVGNETWNSLLK